MFAFFFFLTSESIIHLHHVLEIEKSYQWLLYYALMQVFFIPQRILKTQHTMNYLIFSQWQAAQLKNNRKDNLWANTFNFRKLHFFGYYTLYDYFFLNTYIVCTFEFMVCILYNYSLKHLFFALFLQFLFST